MATPPRHSRPVQTQGIGTRPSRLLKPAQGGNPPQSPHARPRFGDQGLDREIRRLRQVRTLPNMLCLAREYASIAAVIGLAVVFGEYRGSWGIPWAWNIPVFAAAIALVGGLQHRLAGLGHESSHYTLVRNKFWNDFLGDVLCMFPIFTTIHFYRLFHMAHHQYTNDHDKDPDLVNMGRSKRVDEFPMSRLRFIVIYYFRVLVSPLSFLRYQGDYVHVNVLGKGGNVYMKRALGGDAHFGAPRAGTLLGIGYLALVNGVSWLLTATGRVHWLLPGSVLACAAAVAGAYLTPRRFMFHSPFRQAYSERFAGAMRMIFYTLLLAGLAYLRWATGGRSTIYTVVLWIVPVSTTMMFYMLLRDVYQHANADQGRLTNSRVFFADPFTRWAVFVYGQDMHVPHHLFPAIPHYNLPELHRVLRQGHAEYREKVVECRGTFANRRGAPTILDELTKGSD